MIIYAKSPEEKEQLKKHFGFKTEYTYREEQAFLYEMLKLDPSLQNEASESVFDSSLMPVLGKQKSFENPRPDYFWFFQHENKRMAIHGEYDEEEGHEKNNERLERLAKISQCGEENTYVFRVHGRRWDKINRIFIPGTSRGNKVFHLSDHGKSVLEETMAAITSFRELIRAQQSSTEPLRNRVVYINYPPPQNDEPAAGKTLSKHQLELDEHLRTHVSPGNIRNCLPN